MPPGLLTIFVCEVDMGDLVTMGLSEMVLPAGIGCALAHNCSLSPVLVEASRTQACADRVVNRTVLHVESRGGVSKALLHNFILESSGIIPPCPIRSTRQACG